MGHVTADSDDWTECTCGGSLTLQSDEAGRTVATCEGECGVIWFVGTDH